MENQIQVGFGWDSDPDPEVAGLRAGQAALGPLSEEANVAFVFSTVGYDAEKLLAGANRALGIVPIHGGTSFTGIITPEGFKGDGRDVVGVLALASPEVVVGVAGSSIRGNPYQAGERAAHAAFENAGSPDWDALAALMLASPGSEEEVIAGIQTVLGKVPILGGSAADNTLEGHWRIFANDQVYGEGVVLTVFYDAPLLGWAYGSGYRPTDRRAIVTRAQDRTVYELDGKPALKVYAEWTGKRMSDLEGMNLLGASVLSPVGVIDPGSDFYLIKHPGLAGGDGSITLFADIVEGQELVLMEASVDDLIVQVGKTVSKAMEQGGMEREEVAAALLMHCGGRRAAIGKRIDEVVAQVKGAVGGAPFIGYCTFGEQGCLPSGVSVHCDLVLSALVIGE